MPPVGTAVLVATGPPTRSTDELINTAIEPGVSTPAGGPLGEGVSEIHIKIFV